MLRHCIWIGLLLATGWPALADDASPLWKAVAGWKVRVDTTLGNGCFIHATFKGGTGFRIGFDAQEGGAYIILTNPDWRALENGKEYEIDIQFDSEEPWTGTATAMQFADGEPAMLWLGFDDADLYREAMRKTSVEFRYGGQRLAYLSLSGTYAALQEMLACQIAMDEHRQQATSSDPFGAGGSRPARDPFAAGEVPR